jgi:hypothetical protein
MCTGWSGNGQCMFIHPQVLLALERGMDCTPFKARATMATLDDSLFGCGENGAIAAACNSSSSAVGAAREARLACFGARLVGSYSLYLDGERRCLLPTAPERPATTPMQREKAGVVLGACLRPRERVGVVLRSEGRT